MSTMNIWLQLSIFGAIAILSGYLGYHLGAKLGISIRPRIFMIPVIVSIFLDLLSFPLIYKMLIAAVAIFCAGVMVPRRGGTNGDVRDGDNRHS